MSRSIAIAYGLPSKQTAVVVRLALWSLSCVIGAALAAFAIHQWMYREMPAKLGAVPGLSVAVVSVLIAAPFFAFLGYQVNRLKAQHGSLIAIDPMTGLSNRLAFFDMVSQFLEGGGGRAAIEPVALFVHDVDHFKHLNEHWGHEAGDQALVAIGSAFRQNLRSDDVLGRISGDEFAILIPGIDEEVALYIADRMRRAVSNLEFRPGGARHDLTVSIGVSVAHGRMSVDALYHDADRRLCQAKALGGNQVQAGWFGRPSGCNPDTVAAEGRRENMSVRRNELVA